MNLRNVVAASLVVVAVFGTPRIPSFYGSPVQVSAPSEQMKTSIKPVIKVVSRMSSIDRLWLNYIYANAANLVKADGLVEPQTMTTTEGLRAVHVAILKYIWLGMAGNKPGKYEGLKEAIDNAVTDAIGNTRKPLTPELRKKAEEVFEAIAWAGLGKG